MALAFIFSLVLPTSFAQSLPGMTTVSLFQPPVLRGMTVHSNNPLLFDFIVDRGQDRLQNQALKVESEKLIKYFLTSMTIPDQDAWVNLSPYEKDRIIPEALGQTDMGRQMLEQDYLLKQRAAFLTNPNTELGKKYWSQIANGTNLAGKVWIMPDTATVVQRDGFAYITESKLKVMLDKEYRGQKDLSSQEDKSFREVILPQLEKEVNESQSFAATRQVYQSVILATWYKKALKDSLLGRVYANKSKVAGVETTEHNFKQKVYEQYLEVFKTGVYNVIKEETSEDGELIPRKYFSGGNVMNASSALRVDSSLQAVSRAAHEIAQAGDQLALVSSSALEPGENARTAASASIAASDVRAVLSLTTSPGKYIVARSQEISQTNPQIKPQVFFYRIDKLLKGIIPVIVQSALNYPGNDIVPPYTHIAVDTNLSAENDPENLFYETIQQAKQAGKEVIYLRNLAIQEQIGLISAKQYDEQSSQFATLQIQNVFKVNLKAKILGVFYQNSGEDIPQQVVERINLATTTASSTIWEEEPVTVEGPEKIVAIYTGPKNTSSIDYITDDFKSSWAQTRNGNILTLSKIDALFHSGLVYANGFKLVAPNVFVRETMANFHPQVFLYKEDNDLQTGDFRSEIQEALTDPTVTHIAIDDSQESRQSYKPEIQAIITEAIHRGKKVIYLKLDLDTDIKLITRSEMTTSEKAEFDTRFAADQIKAVLKANPKAKIVGVISVFSAPEFSGRLVENLNQAAFSASSVVTNSMKADKGNAAADGGLARPVGGIDFNPNNINLQIKRDGQGVPLPMPQQDLEHIDLKGLYPVIINIQPINPQSLPILSAISSKVSVALSKG